ncbi:MAG TPA: gamma-aminobutyraldehyde dehydrogenase [Actinobacteria bacterium]|nr:gamma-aminobutyraldehyde dehydrogenase [Actinomycetota bacterium]
MDELQNFVGGQWTDLSYDKRAELINPSTGEVFASAPVSGEAEVDAAVASAANAFPEWRDATPAERSLALLKIADAVEAHADELVAAESRNTGKPIALTLSEEIPPMADQIRFFAGAARMLEGRSAGEYMSGYTSFIRREPIGVCAAVTPWNYPMMMATWKWAPALAAGNTMVLKPSDTTPVSTLLMAELMSEFLPAGVFNVITGDRDTGRLLVSHPVPQMVSITGSVRAGKEVAAAAAASLKRVHLELGGKAPLIVLGDADIDAAVSAANFGAFMNQGQICMSTERIVVEKSIADEFAKKLAAKAQALKMGDPLAPETQIGCMINPGAVERVQALVDDAVAKGAKVLCGGKAQGPCYPPTVVYGVTPAMRIYHEESFGPAKPVVIANDAEDALRIANDTSYGLSSAVFSRDVNKALRIAEKLQFGICHINGATVHDEPQMPFGGMKDSGYGKFGGRAGLEEFTELRWVTIRRSPTPYPI